MPAADDVPAVRNAFLRAFLEDLEAGRVRTLADYQALFPGHEALVAREHALLSRQARGDAGRGEDGPAESDDDSFLASAAGRRLGAYVLIRQLGHGGQGFVWLARDTRLERLVALKLLTQLAALSPQALERFRREAQVASRLDDPGICTVYESGNEGDVPFIAMRYVEGESLAEKIERARKGARERRGASRLELPGRARDQSGIARIAELIERVARSLHHAHEAGIVHRDLKPGNVMVARDGSPVLLDFGLAGVLDESFPTLTRTGDIFGTPAYMAPEQISQTGGRVDRRADVYSLGATLYECLTLHPPFASVTREALFQAICHESPIDARRFDAGIPPDLKTILDTCLSKDRDRRYQTALDLAEDLARWRAGEAIRAHPPSRVYRLKKLVQRHRVLSASLLAIGLILSVSTALVARGILRENARAAEVLRLSSLQDLDDLIAEADRLWPAHPENLERYRQWVEEAEALVAALPGYEAQLAELRTRALPWTEERASTARKSHPRSFELEDAQKELAHLERMSRGEQSSGATEEPSAESVGLDWDGLPASAYWLNEIAWPLVDPARKTYGGEARGLVLSRRAVELALPAERAGIRDSLAWALFAAGRFEEAREEEAHAVEEADPQTRTGLAHNLENMEKAIAQETSPEGGAARAERVAELARRIAGLEAEISQRTEWQFAGSQDTWWYNQLEKLVEGIRHLADPALGLLGDGVSPEHGWGVKKRIGLASTIEQESVSGPAAARAWSEACASIADRSECPAYAGLVIRPQLGLLPIGQDHESGLWEFAHLQSGEPARRGADGTLALKEESGLVFVLLPGGTFRMGTQSRDPDEPNYSPFGRSNEGPVHRVSVAAFFLSKYEVTQAQWIRFTGRNPSYFQPGPNGRASSLLHPVELVSWLSCREVSARLGLELPSEAQWEYAARAGTTTDWWTGDEREALRGAANLADQAARRGGATWESIKDWPDLDDGWGVHCPVDRFRANPFGLHNTAGNVLEWCRDAYGQNYYKQLASDDPVCELPGSPNRVVRGGSFDSSAPSLRPGARGHGRPELTGSAYGLRPVRSVN